MFKKFFVEFVLDETQIFQKGLFITLKKPNVHVFLSDIQHFVKEVNSI